MNEKIDHQIEMKRDIFNFMLVLNQYLKSRICVKESN